VNSECREHQESILSGEIPRTHLERCAECRGFYAFERQLAAPNDLLFRTLDRLRPVLRERATARRRIVWRLALAGAVAFPVILGLNAGAVWMLYSALERFVSPIAAAAASYVVGATMLLAFALAYGSLPLLFTWGVQLREKTA